MSESSESSDRGTRVVVRGRMRLSGTRCDNGLNNQGIQCGKIVSEPRYFATFAGGSQFDTKSIVLDVTKEQFAILSSENVQRRFRLTLESVSDDLWDTTTEEAANGFEPRPDDRARDREDREDREDGAKP